MRLLPFISIPIIVTLYLVLKHNDHDILTITRSIMLLSFGYIAAYTDIKTRKIPNKLILTILASWVVIMVVFAIVDFKAFPAILLESVFAGTIGALVFIVIRIITKRGVGGGDVKLAIVMALLLTAEKTVLMIMVSLLLAALVSAFLLMLKRVTLKTKIPFAPFMFAGVLVSILV